MTLSITMLYHDAEYYYAEGRVLFIVILINVIMLNVVKLSVVAPQT